VTTHSHEFVFVAGLPSPDLSQRQPESASILIAWELGAGLGHLMRAIPLVRRFCERGHDVSLAVRDLSRMPRSFEGLDVAYYQAPIKTTRTGKAVRTPRTLAHILHNSGYAVYDELRGRAEAWRSLYDLVRPDLILCDHSPTALLAAAGTGAAVATTGTGFCCPPDLYPLPDFRPWLPDASVQLRTDEDAVLRNVNRVLESWNVPELERLGQLYSRVDECFLATFRELDHYPMRPNGRYWGAWPNAGGHYPRWPQRGKGKRVFVYLHRFKALPDLLRLLNELQLPTLAYCDPLDPETRQNFASETLHFVDQRLDLSEVGRQCDFAILNAGHGTTVSMLLAGKPILQIPNQLEQTLTGLATVRLGAGLSAEPTEPARIARSLTNLVTSDKFAQGAERFAARYAGFDPERQIDRLVARVNQLLHLTSRGPARTSRHCELRTDDNHQFHNAQTVPVTENSEETRTILVGIGTGRCGTRSLAALLSQQVSTAVAHEVRPLLPWNKEAAPQDMKARFEAILGLFPQVTRVGDVAHFYLPYVEDILTAFDDVRVICLQRDRSTTIDSFLYWTVKTRGGRAVNHWSADREGFEADPWDACFPKYSTVDMPKAIGRYWDEYYDRAAGLACRFPERVRIFQTERVLNDHDGTRGLLDWIGIPRAQQNVLTIHANRSLTTHSPTVG
jgi:hypothetical protein